MLKGDISITNRHSTDGDKFVNIRICDELSGPAFIDVNVPIATFAEALFGLVHRPCEFSLNPENVGKRKETMKQRVTFRSRNDDNREKAARKACAPFEVDGWTADWDSLLNPHYSSSDADGNTTGMVTFFRYVPESSETP